MGYTKIYDIRSLFEGCESITKVPDISKWNTENLIAYIDYFRMLKIGRLFRFIKMEYEPNYKLKKCFWKMSKC